MAGVRALKNASAGSSRPPTVKDAATETIRRRGDRYFVVRKMGTWNTTSILDALRRRHREGRPMNTRAVLQSDNALFLAACRRFGDWNAALRAIALDPDRVRRHRRWSPESIVKAILRRLRRGEDMSNAAFKKTDPRLSAAIRTHFKSWNVALRAAGLDPDRYRRHAVWTDDKVLAAIRDIFRRHGKVVSATIGNALTNAVYRRGWTMPQARAMAGLPDASRGG